LRGKTQQIEWRRSQVLELSSKGYNQSDIAKRLQVDKSIISRDVAFLRVEAKENIKKYINERLPEEYEKCLVGVTSIMKEAWNTSLETNDSREKIQALSLAKDCYSMKLDLLTNASVVDDVIKFIEIEKEKHDIQRPEEKDSSSEPRTRPTINQTF
jgi:DNA-binding MarR family transcriptional regulator